MKRVAPCWCRGFTWAVVALAATACETGTGTAPDQGPLQYARDTLAAPLDYSEGEPLIIEHVALRKPQGLELVETFVMPVSERWRLGAGEYPPVDGFEKEGQRARPVPGARVRPARLATSSRTFATSVPGTLGSGG